MIKQFSDIIQIKKQGACATCSTFTYILPTNLTEEIADFLLPFGKVSYNLEKCKIVRVENDLLSIFSARVGSNTLKIKFKKQKEKYKELFDIHIAAFVEKELDIIIEL